MTSPFENRARRILVVDDDALNARMIARVLESEGFSLEIALSGEEALVKISKWDPHLILLDIQMPGLSGMDVLRQLRRKEKYVSILFISGHSSTEDVVSGLDAGADDYIRKPFEPAELLARVRAQLRIKDLNDRLTQANLKLQEMVDLDDLTGLFNMRSLYKKLAYELSRARRYQRSVCTIMMDMDYFKLVNDRHDHLFGSFVLSEVGKIIKKGIRDIDFAARYGGDEFLVVLTEVDLRGCQIFSERLRETIERHEFRHGADSVYLTASIGFALSSPFSSVDEKNLVRLADKALYEAKDAGRNRIFYFDCAQQPNVGDPEVFKSARAWPYFRSV